MPAHELACRLGIYVKQDWDSHLFISFFGRPGGRGQPIFIHKEDALAIVASLRHMMRATSGDDPGRSGQEDSLSCDTTKSM